MLISSTLNLNIISGLNNKVTRNFNFSYSQIICFQLVLLLAELWKTCIWGTFCTQLYYLTFITFGDVGIMSILDMKKLKLREVNCVLHGHPLNIGRTQRLCSCTRCPFILQVLVNRIYLDETHWVLLLLEIRKILDLQVRKLEF